jgi:tetratricopeptide (TPR) repeat protein
VHLLIFGGTRDQRIAAARARCGAQLVIMDAASLPFVRPTAATLAAPGPRTIAIDDIERAFPNAQSGGTRLVLTQSTYLVQKLIDLLNDGDRLIVTADRAALEQRAVEAFQARGPWTDFEIIDLDDQQRLINTKDTKDAEEQSGLPFVSFVSSVFDQRATELLVRAYASASTTERLALCRHAVALAPDDAAAQLALAGAYREAGDMASARAALDRAAALAPEWEAVWYEDGKFWLGYDDMEKARAAFQRAGELMPAFSAAFSNLGATLGELDRPEEALAAFRQALAHDPRGFAILNNVGVVSRELGRLDDSEAALRRVVDLAPDFVFGRYNLGHTLLLAGRTHEALAAYEEGWRRDPEKNPRQGCRLAMARFATGDVEGAARDLWQRANAAPAQREDLLLEAYEIAHALIAQHPALATHRGFLTAIGEAITGRREPLP